MAKAGRGQTRRDSKRRVLRPGESVRADGTYQYKYHTPYKYHTITNITHTMPKLTIAKNSYFVFGNDDIRMAAAHLIILAVADALVPQCLAQKDFDFGVLAADSLHIFMALLLSQLVHDRCNAPR